MGTDLVEAVTRTWAATPVLTQYCLMAAAVALVMGMRKSSKEYYVIAGCAAGYGMMPLVGWFV
jgi:hypothetical protein